MAPKTVLHPELYIEQTSASAGPLWVCSCKPEERKCTKSTELRQQPAGSHRPEKIFQHQGWRWLRTRLEYEPPGLRMSPSWVPCSKILPSCKQPQAAEG